MKKYLIFILILIIFIVDCKEEAKILKIAYENYIKMLKYKKY